MTLTRKMVKLIWFGLGKDSAKRGIITEVGIMKEQLHSIYVKVLDQMFYTPAVKRTGTANNPMHLVTFFQKQIGQIRTVLSGNTSDEGFFKMLLNISDLLEFIVRFRSE